MKANSKIIMFFLLATTLCYSQQDIECCTTFLIDNDTKNIVFSLSKDSVSIGFSIYKPGMETEGARKKYADEYFKKTNQFTRKDIHYSYDYMSSLTPEKLTYLPKDEVIADIENFRVKPVFTNKYYLILKVNEHYYLRWKLLKIPYQ